MRASSLKFLLEGCMQNFLLVHPIQHIQKLFFIPMNLPLSMLMQGSPTPDKISPFVFVHFLLHLYITNDNLCLNKFVIQMDKTKKKKRGRMKHYPCSTRLNNLLTVEQKGRNQNKVKLIPFLIIFFFLPQCSKAL